MTNRFWKLFGGVALATTLSQPAVSQIWEDPSDDKLSKPSLTTQSMDWARDVRTDKAGLQFILNQAPHERLGSSGTLLDLPLPDGGLATFAIAYSPIMASESSDSQPDFQTFRIVDITNSQNTGRVDMTSRGFHAMFMHNGDRVFIDPAETKDSYHTYYDGDYIVKEGGQDMGSHVCGVDHSADETHISSINEKSASSFALEKISFGENLRRYRIAVAATGEYTQYFGGTASDGQAGIVTAINRLNAIFEAEMAIRLELVSNNENVVFTDPDTDPFTHSDRSVLIGEVGDVLNAEIGNENYDIGHVFGVFGGGVATLGSVCRNSKARGVSGTSRPDRSSFVTLLAHEVGHQFNAPHTFNGSRSNCEDNRSSRGAVEPHSGSTIMSYAGICGSENLRGGKDTFFHNSSLTFMNEFVENPLRGGSCPVLTQISNVAPEVEAGADGVIPILTPFELTGSASDADGDDLTHIWEQLDVGPANDGPDDFEDDGQRALFRSFQPSASTSRTFPELPRVLANDYVMGEVYPSTDRQLTFRMTTRDGNGGVTDDERILQTVSTAGPFIMETPTRPALEGAFVHTVEWDVANTTADPINCEAVRLSLSVDGGQTFEYELAASTANTGSADVEFPNLNTVSARLKANCTTQPFFAINDTNFSITESVIVNEPPNAVNDDVSVEEDSLRIEIDVLDNDSDPEGDALILGSAATPDNGGSVEVSGDVVIYTPAPGFIGTETFNYTVGDGNDNTSSATVTVTVTPKPNVAPDLMDDTQTVAQDSGATLIDVTSNDIDADGDVLSLDSLGTPDNGGTVAIESNQVSYTPAAGFNGTEIFSYTVTDGEGASVTANVTVTVTAAPPPPPPTTVTPQPAAADSGGGGSFGPFLLLLIWLRNRVKNIRLNRTGLS